MVRLRTVLSNSALRSIYFAIFHQHLQYGIVAWGFTTNKNLKRIDTLQRKAIRLISRAKLSANLDPIYKSLGVMKTSDIRNFEVAKFIYRLKAGHTSSVFSPLCEQVHTHGTRQSTQQKYHITRSKLQTTRKGINCTGTAIWNNIYHKSYETCPVPHLRNYLLLIPSKNALNVLVRWAQTHHFSPAT